MRRCLNAANCATLKSRTASVTFVRSDCSGVFTDGRSVVAKYLTPLVVIEYRLPSRARPSCPLGIRVKM